MLHPQKVVCIWINTSTDNFKKCINKHVRKIKLTENIDWATSIEVAWLTGRALVWCVEG